MGAETVSTLRRSPRRFVPEQLKVKEWKNIAPFFENLAERTISSVKELLQWLHDRSELESVVQEEGAWRYIRMSCNTADEEASADYNYFISQIEPYLSAWQNKLNLKLLSCPFISEIEDPGYALYLKQVKERVNIFREENIPVITAILTEDQEYSVISGNMTIDWEGKELTLPEAANLLKEQDRSQREKAYHLIVERRLRDAAALDTLFDKLIALRGTVAHNAGFENYRDYMFRDLCRFDYTAEDCRNYHEAIRKNVEPIVTQLERERKATLHVPSLRPWDLEVDVTGKPPLKPFQHVDELMDKTIRCFTHIHPFLGECMSALRTMKHVDLGSRKGKAPGGYNYPLYETGVPFIFMNATSSLRDLVTIVHEGGHAVHSILTRSLPHVAFKDIPSEVAELASMSMELISMEHWNFFFDREEDVRRARRQHLEKIIRILPITAAVDKFQHWVYTHPGHTQEERKKEWTSIFQTYMKNAVDYSGYESAYASSWHNILHIFQLPFYYIEYGFAQLGAIAIWRNYRKDPQTALHNYMEALKLGYTRSIPEIYERAGIRFDFSENYVRELMDFVKGELRKM